MNTLILISGGWKSAYMLIRWLRTHSEKCAVLHCRLGNGRDNDEDRGYATVRGYVERMFPGRVEWYDSTFGHFYKNKSDPARVLKFMVDQFRDLSGHDVKKINVIKQMGLGRGETVMEINAADAMIEIPDNVMGGLIYCETSPLLPCGKCPACLEVAAARAQVGR
jgi:7-cyano-7-deazaguanine synthase in queuosine biosynthesis